MEKIDKEVFDKFFTESYCEVDYATVKESFEEFLVRVNKAWKVSYRKASSAFKK